ncbi:hypothetical protein [Marininema halotolerans]|uniref:Uncharacterized protein n=1 Tax=Marininema halotolerans TaxID=1155944 RepID=A0A1I6UNB4_9BACL|nr:hypothetical protein [Marininema halotolerans]SFT02888.1 hypothetical protein SAMN05444972_11845 [Marininema halotolerans]
MDKSVLYFIFDLIWIVDEKNKDQTACIDEFNKGLRFGYSAVMQMIISKVSDLGSEYEKVVKNEGEGMSIDSLLDVQRKDGLKNENTFLTNLISALKVKYNSTINEKNDFISGENFSYYDILDIIESQLILFDYDITLFDNITPILGQKVK